MSSAWKNAGTLQPARLSCKIVYAGGIALWSFCCSDTHTTGLRPTAMNDPKHKFGRRVCTQRRKSALYLNYTGNAYSTEVKKTVNLAVEKLS